MMKQLWELIPGWMRKVLIVFAIIFYTPWYLREQALTFVDARVHATIMPLKEKRDAEITNMRNDIHEIKTDIRDIKNHLMGPRRDQ